MFLTCNLLVDLGGDYGVCASRDRQMVAELASQILTLAMDPDADLMSSDLRLTVSLFLLERFTDWSSLY